MSVGEWFVRKSYTHSIHLLPFPFEFLVSQSLDFSYCPQFGREELLCLVPLSRTLKHLGLKGTYVEDDGFVAFLAEVNAKIQSSSLLESIDLSAISKDCSLRVGNKSVDAISVSGLFHLHRVLLCILSNVQTIFSLLFYYVLKCVLRKCVPISNR
jgi:hypothetical protein